MMRYFHRQVQLWGEDTQKVLQDKKIAIIGSGGLGSSLAYALGSSGIGEIHMIDFHLAAEDYIEVVEHLVVIEKHIALSERYDTTILLHLPTQRFTYVLHTFKLKLHR